LHSISEPFPGASESVIRLPDIVCFHCNWQSNPIDSMTVLLILDRPTLYSTRCSKLFERLAN